MANSSTILDSIDDLPAASLRSRASSIVTTTTKFSLETLAQDDRSSTSALWERQHRHSHAGRPNSITSVAHPAPPYTESADAPLQFPTHNNGEFQGLLSRLAEVAERPAEATSLHEPLGPSTITSSGNTTPAAPDSPLDPELSPQAQAAYYSNVVRTLDSNYTAELERLRQKHAQELAMTRHDIDAAYRAHWKAQNREIEKIREEAAKSRDVEVDLIRAESGARIQVLEEKVRELERALIVGAEEGHQEREIAAQRARHEVEDLWERRWRDRAKVEEEERKRAEVERQRVEAEREKAELERERAETEKGKEVGREDQEEG